MQIHWLASFLRAIVGKSQLAKQLANSEGEEGDKPEVDNFLTRFVSENQCIAWLDQDSLSRIVDRSF